MKLLGKCLSSEKKLVVFCHTRGGVRGCLILVTKKCIFLKAPLNEFKTFPMVNGVCVFISILNREDYQWSVLQSMAQSIIYP